MPSSTDPVGLYGRVQLDGGGVVEPNPVEAAVNPFAGYGSGGSLHDLHFPREAGFIAIAADAPRSVAAHFPYAAVGVEKQHTEVSTLLGGVCYHQSVRAYGEMPFAEGAGYLRETFVGNVFFQVVENDEVVSCAVHFPEFHDDSTFI